MAAHRMIESMSNQRAERIKGLLADLIAFDTVSDRTNLPLIDYIEKYLTPFGITDMKPEHALVTLAKQLAGRNGHAKVGFGTEASLFVGIADIPAVAIGPAESHKPTSRTSSWSYPHYWTAPASSSG
jgi:hypothetical protein